MAAIPRNFWRQPARGFTATTRGRTEAELDAAETALGCALPSTYRLLMSQQNGGALRYTAVAGLAQVSFDLLSKMRSDDDSVSPLLTFRDYILYTCDDEELDAVMTELAPFHPERLLLISPLDGHSGAYLDYGFRSEAPALTPGVLFVHDDGDDFLHFGVMSPSFVDFDEFLASLSEDPDRKDSEILGVVSTVPYEELVHHVADALALTLNQNVDDDQNGTFNFDSWHDTYIPVELDERTLQSVAAANGTTLDEMIEWTHVQARSSGERASPKGRAHVQARSSGECASPKGRAHVQGATRNLFAVTTPNQHRSGTFQYPDCPQVQLVVEIRTSWFPLQQPMAGLIQKLRKIPAVDEVVLLPSGTVTSNSA
jgi:hypothetical protein